MAELEDVTLDGKPLHSLRVADLKAALEQRGLAKSGQKNALIKRLKGALMLESLQRTSTSHAGLQPNSQIGEEMSQNSFIKQYLAKQQELLRQRMEKEAREAAEADDSPAGPKEDDHRAANDLPDKHHVASRPSVPEDGGGDQLNPQDPVALGGQRLDASTASVSHESTDVPAAKIWRPSFSQEEVATPSPPRAVASLSVRVVGQPERQGVPLIVPRPQQSVGTAPIEAGPAHPMPQLSQSSRTQEDSDEDDDDDDDDDSDEDDNWGPSTRGRKNIQTPPAQRSRRKLQPPQHIPPHHSPLQLRQPTPPPSPPPELSFPLPDTPKQSPPEQDEPEGPERAAVSSPVSLQRQESSSSSRSSSPEPPSQRRPGPLSLLVRKMESEGAFDGGQKKDEEEEGDTTAAAEEHTEAGPGVLVFSREATDNAHTSCDSEVVPDHPDSPQEKLPEESESPPTMPAIAESSSLGLEEMKKVEMEQENSSRTDEEEKGDDLEGCSEEKEKEKEAKASFNVPSWKRERDESLSLESADLRPTSPLPSPPAPAKRARMFSEVPPPECLLSPSKPEQVSVLVSGPQHANTDDKMELDVPISSPRSSPEKEHETNKEMNEMEIDLQAPARSDDRTDDINEPPLTLPPSPPSDDMAAEKERESSEENQRASSSERDKTRSEERLRKPSLEREGKSSAEREGKGSEEKETGMSTQRENKISAESERSKERGSEISAEKEQPKESDGKISPEKSFAEKKMEKSTVREREGSVERKKSPKQHSSPSSQSSSSDSDSDSESSSSSSSGSSPHDKPRPTSLNKDAEKKSRSPYYAAEKKEETLRDVKQATVAEPTGPVSMELQEQPESESALSHPASQEAPETSESRSDESTTPKAFAARKISLTTAKPEGATVDTESGGGAGRKRRWGSSTAVTAKKPSISITTESLKSLIPDLKPLQEAVVDLHPDEGRFSGDEDSGQPPERDEDQGLQIRRTVTQVVPAENQENGQKEKEGEEEEEDEEEEDEEQTEAEKEKTPKKQRRESFGMEDVAMETQEGDTKKVTPSDSVVRRSISQQKVAVSITIDDPVRTGRQLSPPRGKTSNIIHVCNLVRPFTLGQLKELLNRTGKVVEDGFWIDKIKSHCYVTYSSTEEAVATREALHGVKWPSSNPKVLRVDFCEQKELDFHKGLLTGEDPRAAAAPNRPAAPPPLMPPTREKEREREKGPATNVRDQWAEREREMERRERTRSEREWDRDKVRDFNRDEREAARRSRSRDRDRRRKERGKSKEKKSEKKDKPEEPPAKLLDDLFRKTKAAPCIYWLPLTEEQVTQKNLERAERMKEREKRRKELQEEEDKKREEERKERARGRERERERDGGNMASSGAGSGRPEGEKDKDRERDRERERERERGRERDGEKRRDSNRGRGADSKPVGGSRRSRSHSNPSRDRRR